MNEEFDDIIKNELEIDDKGINKSITFSLDRMAELGIEDVNSFTAGIIDSLNDADFNESNKDYIKGYKYGQTGEL